jgi:excisionase family DNA binding protein
MDREHYLQPSSVIRPHSITSSLLATPQSITSSLLATQQAADFLSVSESTIHKLAREGRIQRVRIGRAVRYRGEDLLAFVSACRTPAVGNNGGVNR